MEIQLAAMQEDASQCAIASSAVLKFLRNQILFYRQRNFISLAVPTAVATPALEEWQQDGPTYTLVERRHYKLSLIHW
eukprot:6113469-Pleurochrysis_carterae.AAC.1